MEDRRAPRFGASKFTRPAATRVLVHRPRLEQALAAGADQRLTVVTGSAGSGKTTLLSRWAAGQPEGAVAWFACDRADLDDLRFWYGVISTVRRQRPEFGSECLDLLALSRRVDDDVLEAFLSSCETVVPLTLILDDFHLVGPAAQSQLDFVVGRGTGGLRLVVGSRTEPLLSLDRLRVAGDLCELREIDLRMDRPEADRLLRQLGVRLHDPGLAVVMGRTEGWAVGLQLAAVALAATDQRDSLLSRLSGSDATVGHYLWSEVFSAQRPEAQRFMLDTCVVEELTPDLAAALSPGSRVTLLEIEDANLFLTRIDRAGLGFRYHQLFVEMLRHRLHSSEPAHELVLHERAATWHLDRGDTTGAFRHLWRCGDRATAIRGVHGKVLDDYFEDRLPTFDDADRLLSDEDLTVAPGPAISYCGALVSRGHLADAARLAARIDMVASPLLDVDELGQLRGIQGAMALAMGDTRAAGAYGSLLLGAPPEPDPAREWPMIGLVVAARSLAWEGRHEAAQEILSSARLRPLSRVAQLELDASMAFCALLAGNLSEAEILARRHLLPAVVDHERIPDAGLQPTAVVGTALLERGQLAAAEPLLTEVADAKSNLRQPIRLFAKLGLSRIHRARGEVDRAGAALDEAWDTIGRRPPGSGCIDHVLGWQARFALAADDTAVASRLIEEIADPFLKGLLRTHLTLVTGNSTRARLELDDLRGRSRTRRQLLEVELTRLRIDLVEGTDAQHTATTVLDLSEPEGLVQPVAESGSAVLAAVRRASRRRPRSAHLEALSAARPWMPLHPGERSILIEPLSVREKTVLGYLDTALTVSEIADELFVSANTVKTHIKNITRKLRATSRGEAVANARRLHYL